jgi:hypothetical protein
VELETHAVGIRQAIRWHFPGAGASLSVGCPDRGDRAARASPHQTRSPPPHHLDKCAVKVGAPAEAPVLAQMFGRSSCPLKWHVSVR